VNTQKNKPGDYALGSLESRVAARVTLERMEADRNKDLEFVKIEFKGLPEGDQILYVPKKRENR
jgi:hypothetical protein